MGCFSLRWVLLGSLLLGTALPHVDLILVLEAAFLATAVLESRMLSFGDWVRSVCLKQMM
jgi:hypothetical protein